MLVRQRLCSTETYSIVRKTSHSLSYRSKKGAVSSEWEVETVLSWEGFEEDEDAWLCW